MTSEAELEALVAEALERFDLEGLTGLDAFCSAHADCADRLRQVVLSMAETGLLQPPGSSLPERVGGYRLLRRLGSGGMGVVFEGIEERTGRRVAVKLIRPELLFFENSRERFRREVESISRLQHPGIVPVLAVGCAEDLPWFAMEQVSGRTLEHIVADVQDRAPEQLTGLDLWHSCRKTEKPAEGEVPTVFNGSWIDAIVHLLVQVARAVHHAHLSGIIHRDLKPSNVMITPEGRAMVLDFGLAHVGGTSRLTRSGATLGSPAYMSPEQLRGEAIDVRTDVYSLGATLQHALVLAPPFRDRSEDSLRRSILTGARERPRARNRSVPRTLERVLAIAMDPDRAYRYPDMQSLAGDLERFLSGEDVGALRPGRLLRGSRWVRRHPPALPVLVAFAALLLALPPILLVHQSAANQALERERRQAETSFLASVETVNRMLERTEDLDEGASVDATALRRQMQLDALMLYEDLMDRLPESGNTQHVRARTLWEMAKLLIDLGDVGGGQECYRRVVRTLQEMGPSAVRAHFLLFVRSQRALGRLDEIERAAEDLALNGDDPDALVHASYALLLSQTTDEDGIPTPDHRDRALDLLIRAERLGLREHPVLAQPEFQQLLSLPGYPGIRPGGRRDR